jgi:hypothetical protein
MYKWECGEMIVMTKEGFIFCQQYTKYFT